MHEDSFNFTRDVLERLARERPSDEALRAIGADGSVRSYSFEQAAAESAAAAAGLARAGVGRGDVVMTLMGARPEWVFALLGAWRLGAVALPCSEQLRAQGHRPADRAGTAGPGARCRARHGGAAGGARGRRRAAPRCTTWTPTASPAPSAAGEPADTARRGPGAVDLHVRHRGRARARVVHTQGYLRGQATQAEHWFGPRAGELAWCTAASGWSKSARNAFVAPWTRGAAALLHDARFEPAERLAVAAEQGSPCCASPRPSTA